MVSIQQQLQRQVVRQGIGNSSYNNPVLTTNVYNRVNTIPGNPSYQTILTPSGYRTLPINSSYRPPLNTVGIKPSYLPSPKPSFAPKVPRLNTVGNLLTVLLAEYLKNLSFPFQGLGDDSGQRQFQPIVNVTVSKNRYDLGDSITFTWDVQTNIYTTNDLIKVFFKGLDSEDYAEVSLSDSVTFITDRDIYRLVIKAENRDKNASRTNGKLLLKRSNNPDPDPDPVDEGIFLDETTGKIIGLKANKTYDLTLQLNSSHYSGNYIDDVVYQVKTDSFTNDDLNNIYIQSLKQNLNNNNWDIPSFIGKVLNWSFPENYLFSEGSTYAGECFRLICKNTNNTIKYLLVNIGIDFRPIPRPLENNPDYLYDEIGEIEITVIRLDEMVDLTPVLNRITEVETQVSTVNSKVTNALTKIDDLKDTIGDKVRDIGNNGQEIRRNFQQSLESLKRNKKTQEIINLLTLLVALHNAAMLSSDVIVTLLSVIDIGLGLTGLTPKDDDGNDLTVSTVIGNSISSLLNQLIGEEIVSSVNEIWLKASKTYQSASNVINAIQSHAYTIQSGLETIAANNSKANNAFIIDGVLREESLEYQPEKYDFANKLFTRIEKTNNMVNKLSYVAQEVKSIQNTVNEFKELKKDLDDTIKETEKQLKIILNKNKLLNKPKITVKASDLTVLKIEDENINPNLNPSDNE